MPGLPRTQLAQAPNSNDQTPPPTREALHPPRLQAACDAGIPVLSIVLQFRPPADDKKRISEGSAGDHQAGRSDVITGILWVDVGLIGSAMMATTVWIADFAATEIKRKRNKRRMRRARKFHRLMQGGK